MNRIKCKKPLAHNPQFEGKYHCKRCEMEALLDLIDARKCECGEEE